MSANDKLIYELNEMIDGGDECAGRDTQITELIEIAKGARQEYREVLQAFDDLSSGSYTVFHRDPAWIALFNRTFEVLKKHRALSGTN